MTLEERVTELERRAGSNDEAHETTQQILAELLTEVKTLNETVGQILSVVNSMRQDQKKAV